MLRIILMVMALAASTAHADDWRTEDTQCEIAYQVVAAMDWAQTRNIARNPGRWEEQNPVLGKHPSVGEVDAYFAVMGVLHYAVSEALPVEYRSAWQYVSIILESRSVVNNYSIGLSMRF